MKLYILLFVLLSAVISLEAQQPYGNHQNSHNSNGYCPQPSNEKQGMHSPAQCMSRGEALFVRLSGGTVAFHGVRKPFEPVELTILQGQTKSVLFRSSGDYPQEAQYSVQLSMDGRYLYLDSDSRSPAVINNTGWKNGCSYTANQSQPNSRMMADGVDVYVKTVWPKGNIRPMPKPKQNPVSAQTSFPDNSGNDYGNRGVVTVTIEGGYVAFFGKRKHYQPVAFDIRCGERKEVEFCSTDKYPRKTKFWMRLSEDGNTLRVDDGQRKEIVLINHDWERGQVYHPKERDDHGSRMEALDVAISVRNKNMRGFKPEHRQNMNPNQGIYRGTPVTVIVEEGQVAFHGKRKKYHPVAFDIYPGESKKVEFTSTDKYPRKMSYLMELSEDGNTLRLDADQRKAILLINRNWEHGEVYHPEESDDHGSRMEALGIKVTVRQKGKKHH
jgi:hypothetical protein